MNPAVLAWARHLPVGLNSVTPRNTLLLAAAMAGGWVGRGPRAGGGASPRNVGGVEAGCGGSKWVAGGSGCWLPRWASGAGGLHARPRLRAALQTPAAAACCPFTPSLPSHARVAGRVVQRAAHVGRGQRVGVHARRERGEVLKKGAQVAVGVPNLGGGGRRGRRGGGRQARRPPEPSPGPLQPFQATHARRRRRTSRGCCALTAGAPPRPPCAPPGRMPGWGRSWSRTPCRTARKTPGWARRAPRRPRGTARPTGRRWRNCPWVGAQGVRWGVGAGEGH